MKRLIFLLLALVVAGTAGAANTVQVMTDGVIDVDRLPTISFFQEGDPASPELGQIWWNNSTAQLKVAGALGVYAFNSTSLVEWDTTPEAFSFTDVTNATTNSTYVSDPITVSGINWPTAISVSGDASAKYSVNNATAVSTDGTVVSGDSVRAVVTSSASDEAAVNATVTIGGVADAFSVTTAAADESVTYLLYEDFEDGAAPSGWSAAGSGRTYNSTTSPLEGTYSLALAGSTTVSIPTWTSTSTLLSGYFRFRAESGGAGNCKIFFRKSTTTEFASAIWPGSGAGVIYYTLKSTETGATQQSSNFSANTDYILWWELETVYDTTKSRVRIWVTSASTTERPETPTATTTANANAETPNEMYITIGSSTNCVLDDFVVAESSVTTIQ